MKNLYIDVHSVKNDFRLVKFARIWLINHKYIKVVGKDADLERESLKSMPIKDMDWKLIPKSDVAGRFYALPYYTRNLSRVVYSDIKEQN
ncbi:hypothetical protein ACFL40_04415 [candidate division KSB1 bacterium]